ncbi:polyphosphate polymerase domain-containing protein [Patescibacteria group bacterium]|nr:polyphosphate polymerase domain-containing protein [Patescibacteria group bacterium]
MNEDKLALNRIEKKFQLFGMDKNTICRVLHTNCRRIIHEDRVNIVQSLYFDDDELSSYYENQDGIARRSKARIRWYNSDDIKNVYFEFKNRQGEQTSKDRMKLNFEKPLSKMTFREIKKELIRQLSNEAGERFLVRLNPVLINRYKREYFHDPHYNIRATLDYNIKCYDQIGQLKPNFRFARQLDDIVILECKMATDLIHSMREILDPLKLRVSRSSKYVQCLEVLNQN